MSELLLTKLSAVRRKQAMLAAGRGVAQAAGGAVLLLAVGMLLDYAFELPRWLRAALLAIDNAAVAYVLLKGVVVPVLFAPDDDEVALMVERATPEFRTRLIASVQLTRPGALVEGTSPSLVRALVRQTETLAEPMDFTQVVRAEQFLRTAVIAALVVLTGAVSFLYARDTAPDLLARAFLANVPVPRDTTVECLTGDRTIAIGQEITIEALAHGVIPADGRVDLKYASGRTQTFTMERAPDAFTSATTHPVTRPSTDPSEIPLPRFVRTIGNVQESFTYSVRLNDGHSLRFTVEAVPRPVVTALELSQSFPAYTKRSAERRSPGDLSLLAGSKLQVKAKSNKPLRSASIKLVGLEQEIPMTVAGSDATGVIDVPAKGMTGFSVQLTDSRGIDSKNDTVYPVDLIPDKEPAIRITAPDRKEELATQQARLLVGFEASDDFGVATILVHYRIEGQGTGDSKSFELDLGNPADPRRVRFRYELDLAKLRPMPLEGSAVEYWLEVRDGNDVSGPGKTFSEHYRAKIVSDVEKRADLANRLNDQLGTIDFVTQDQEKLNQNLGTLIFEKP